MKFLKIIIISVLFLISCTEITPNLLNTNLKSELENKNANITITGNVKFPKSFNVKANLENIANNTVVSLQYPGNYHNQELKNTTIATGLTDISGNFKINPDVQFSPVSREILILEATKRGIITNEILSLRTYVRWEGNYWESITKPNVFINAETTTLTLISEINTSSLSPEDTIGKITINNAIVSFQDINSLITVPIINNVRNLVNTILNEDIDPIGNIIYKNNNYTRKQRDEFINKKIIFGSMRDGNDEIYSMDLNGNNQYRLTNTLKQDVQQKISPNKSKIVYISGWVLCVMNIDGTEQKKLTNDNYDYFPSWSPDSSKILFESSRNGDYDVYSINADGTELKQLTKTPGYNSVPESWSPDGNKISFISNRDGKGNSEIYIMNADGTEQKRLTNNLFQDQSSIWTKDSKKLIFTTYGNGVNLNQINIDGTNQIKLTDNLFENQTPVISPDGLKIVFYSNRDGNGEIYSMNSDGSGQINLTNNIGDDYLPSWSYDGKKILFSSKRDNNYEIYVMNADGTEQTRLTNNSFFDLNPKW